MIAEKISEARKKKGVSMRQAAKDMGFPYTTYVNYEKGVSEPNSEALVRIAMYYQVSADYLVGVNERSWDIDVRIFAEQMEQSEKMLMEYLQDYFADEEQTIAFELIKDLPRLNKEGLLEAKKRIDELSRLEEYENDLLKECK